MNVFFGNKLVFGIYKGSTPIHGIMVGSKLYHGEVGYTYTFRPEYDPDYTHPLGLKACYNCSISRGYTTNLYGSYAYHPTILTGGRLVVTEFSSKTWGDWTLAPVIGSAMNVTIEPYGVLFVGDGDGHTGFSENVTISSGGTMYVCPRGTVNLVTVSSDGHVTISSGGTALNVTSETGAKITVSSGGYITYT